MRKPFQAVLLSTGLSRGLFAGTLLVAAFFSPAAQAFPENVRHGYTNCIACHVNPNGQGLLNDYGRQLSKAIQSYGKFFFEPAAKPSPAAAPAGDDRDPEIEFLYGAVPHPQWLQLGGDVRFLQLFQNTPSVSSAQFINMQMDLEAAATVGKFTLDATVGRIDPTVYGTTNPGFTDYILSRRHFLLFQATDEIFLMGGRFWKPYGILDPNHSSAVKESLGWNFGTESYNVEAGYLGNNVNVLVYGDFGRPGDSPLSRSIESGGGATASVGFAGTYKAGLSYFYGKTDAQRRHVFGPWALLGFTDHFYLNSENDFVRSQAQGASAAGGWASGFATYNRLGYEFIQGVHGYLEQGFNQLDFNQDPSKVQIYGVGMLYYPRAHWEFEADLQKRKYGAAPTSEGFTDYLYFQLHYYL